MSPLNPKNALVVGRRAIWSGRARMAWRPADPPVSAAPRAHDEDREAAQTTRADMGPTAEVEEPAGPQGDHPGDHRDLQNKRLTGEMVEQAIPRTAETVQDICLY
ncbi:hypothetical protein D4764_09G0010390 [Takifugu flavidus]|uniref:Uncharacterized protein n=1 Tax=Takifugu flavidus TaxID=433684 RepID=A0A5C6MMJ5_9TELE|nr:hypothetical protein D4764_09G0010390 [Takifugu flavidus]